MKNVNLGPRKGRIGTAVAWALWERFGDGSDFDAMTNGSMVGLLPDGTLEAQVPDTWDDRTVQSVANKATGPKPARPKLSRDVVALAAELGVDIAAVEARMTGL